MTTVVGEKGMSTQMSQSGITLAYKHLPAPKPTVVGEKGMSTQMSQSGITLAYKHLPATTT